MAKTDIEYGPERLPSLRGSFYLRRQRGNIVMCAWPKKQKRKKSAKRQAAMDMFADASEAVKRMDQSQIQRAMDLTPGTQALWRDVLFLSMYGRLPAILTIGSQEYRPLAGRKDATEILDALGLVEGGVLYRGESYWEILPPGADGEVLAFDAANNKPYWSPSAGGGGSFALIERAIDVPIGPASYLQFSGLDFANADYELRINLKRSVPGAASIDYLKMQFGSDDVTPTWFTGTVFVSAVGSSASSLTSSGGITRVAQVRNNATANMASRINLMFGERGDGLGQVVNGHANSAFWENTVQFDGSWTGSGGGLRFNTEAQAWLADYSLYAIEK